MSLFYIQGYTIFLVFFMQEIGTIRNNFIPLRLKY